MTGKLLFVWDFFQPIMPHIVSFAGQIYCSVLGGNIFSIATTPLFFELASELGYPSPEVIVGGLLTGTMNFVGLLFLFIFMVPDIGMACKFNVDHILINALLEHVRDRFIIVKIFIIIIILCGLTLRYWPMQPLTYCLLYKMITS